MHIRQKNTGYSSSNPVNIQQIIMLDIHVESIKYPQHIYWIRIKSTGSPSTIVCEGPFTAAVRPAPPSCASEWPQLELPRPDKTTVAALASRQAVNYKPGPYWNGDL